MLRRHRRLIAPKWAIDDTSATRRRRPRRMVEIELQVGPVARENAWVGSSAFSNRAIT